MCKVITGFFCCERRIELQHARVFNDAAVFLHVMIEHCCFHHALEHLHLFHGEVFDEAKVEERYAAIFMENVITGVRISVECTEAIQTAKDETEDCFANVIAFLLCPFKNFSK